MTQASNRPRGMDTTHDSTPRRREPGPHRPAPLARRVAAAALAMGLLLAPGAGAGQAPGQAEDSTTTDTPAARADTFALPGIVVTATRVPLARETLPTPVTVWTREELRARGIRTVAEALETVPAATVARAGSPGAQTSLFLRGGESDYVKVLIDGVAVNDPGGAFDFADLSTDQVERIEVVRGPVSVLYGSDAVSGVVQVFTRRPSGGPTLSAQLSGGRGQERDAAGSAGGSASAPTPATYGLMDAEATLTGAAGPVAYVVGGSRSWSGGLYPFNNDRDHGTGTARLSWTAPGAEIALSTRYTDSRSHFPTDGTGALVDEDARLDRRLWTTTATAGFRIHRRLDGRVQAGLVTRDQASI
ncbi:MAG: TonB-dependent receptor plug domain-containing protein, partial [Longimicrobiales bacterium]|nr:TonB-dependent receptor plug domain-containing protein [Longimicrobiales bacterium]